MKFYATSYWRHMSTVHAPDEKLVHSCGTCGRKFPHLFRLRRHEKTHLAYDKVEYKLFVYYARILNTYIALDCRGNTSANCALPRRRGFAPRTASRATLGRFTRPLPLPPPTRSSRGRAPAWRQHFKLTEDRKTSQYLGKYPSTARKRPS